MAIATKHCAMAAAAMGGRRVNSIKNSFMTNVRPATTSTEIKIAAALSAMTTARFSNGMIAVAIHLRDTAEPPAAAGDRRTGEVPAATATAAATVVGRT